MGTTFANLQIHNISINEAEKLSPGSLIKQFNPHWITITSENFEVGNIEQIVRKISKQIESAVLSVEVYDDDIFILNVFKKGKKVASHISDTGYGYYKKVGNPVSFVRELELPEGYVEYFKWILKCEDMGKKIQLLEKTLAIPLWINDRMLLESQTEYNNIELDLDYIESYINEKKALKKIKNAAKAKLLMEFDGKLCDKLGSSIYLINKPSSDDNYYEYNEHYIFKAQKDGQLEPLFNADHFHFDIYDKYIIANDQCFAVLETLQDDDTREKKSLSLYDYKGRLITETKLPRAAGYPLLLIDNSAILCSNYGENQIIGEYGMDGSKKWEFEAGYLDVSPMIYNGYIYLYHSNYNTNKSELLKMNRNGEVIATLDLNLCGGAHWSSFQFDNQGNFYFCLHVNEDDRYFDKLVYLDKDLNIISEVLLDGSSFECLLDDYNKKLYISIFEKELLAVDTKQNAIYAQRRYEETSNLRLIDARGRVMISKGMSTVEVFDSNLNIISRHRLKGMISDVYRNSAGNACFLTKDIPKYATYADEVKSTIRIYEIL